MKSKWYELKEKAIKMRLNGASIRSVEVELGIPRSTLSGWFKDVTLSTEHEYILHQNWLDGLVSARTKAVKWHRDEKEKRLETARSQAHEVITKIDLASRVNMELALAMLYLGEGFKTTVTGMGNSDPLILRFFISLIKKLYNANNKDFSCHLHLRADQNPEEMIFFWSETLNLPRENFGKCSIDLRTKNKRTYDTYKGVCVIRCGNVAIQRKLVYLSKIYCEKIIASTSG